MARVKVEVHCEKGMFDAGMKSVQGQLHEMKSLVASAFSGAAIAGIIAKTFAFADAIDKASLRMKMTTEETQVLKRIADDSGSSLDTIEGAFRKIEIARSKALGGDASMKANFKTLGVDDAMLKDKNNIIKIGAQVSSAAQHGSNDTQGVALAGLGIKGAAGDLTAIGDALKTFDEVAADLEGRGAIMSDKDIANMVQAQDEMEVMAQVALTQLAPFITGFLEYSMLAFDTLSIYFKNFFGMIVALADVAFEYLSNKIKHPFTAQPEVLGKVTNVLQTTAESFVSDSMDAEEDRQKKKNAMMDARASARSNQGTTNTLDKADKLQKAKAYDDSLTKSGNFLGASMRNAGSVVSQLDLEKQQLAVQKEIVAKYVIQQELLRIIANNTKPAVNGNEDITNWNPP